MHTTNYIDTFIEVAPDWQGLTAKIPDKDGSVAKMQYDMIVDNPYKFTSDDVLFDVFAERNGLSKTQTEREKYFSKGQACLRASPLTKTHGWGVHSDKNGRIALYPFESDTYKKLVSDTNIKHVKAMRVNAKGSLLQ